MHVFVYTTHKTHISGPYLLIDRGSRRRDTQKHTHIHNVINGVAKGSADNDNGTGFFEVIECTERITMWDTTPCGFYTFCDTSPSDAMCEMCAVHACS